MSAAVVDGAEHSQSFFDGDDMAERLTHFRWVMTNFSELHLFVSFVCLYLCAMYSRDRLSKSILTINCQYLSPATRSEVDSACLAQMLKMLNVSWAFSYISFVCILRTLSLLAVTVILQFEDVWLGPKTANNEANWH